MVVSRTRSMLEFIATLVIAGLVGVIAHGYAFLGLENDVLLSVIAGVVALVIVAGLFSLRNSARTRWAVRRRYGVSLTLNEASFLLRTGGEGHGVVTNASNQDGLWLKNPLRADWALCTARGAELTRASA